MCIRDSFIITHNLVKKTRETKKSTLDLRDAVYDADNSAAEGLLTGLRNSVTRSAKIGKVERDEDGVALG